MGCERIIVGDGSVYLEAERLNSEWRAYPRKLVLPLRDTAIGAIQASINGVLTEGSVRTETTIRIALSEGLALSIKSYRGGDHELAISLTGDSRFTRWMKDGPNRLYLLANSAHIEAISVGGWEFYRHLNGSECHLVISACTGKDLPAWARKRWRKAHMGAA